MKQYNGEKAVISLTSWKARINTVSKTIYSLIQKCPGFHIVLVLSEEEFPKKEAELPDDLMLFVENDLIEILWVYKNYKSFKKVLFTLDKYRNVPVISADDDCICLKNYAEVLYKNWIKYKKSKSLHFISNGGGTGYGCLFSPNVFNGFDIKLLTQMIDTNNDDALYQALCNKYDIKKYYLTLNKHEYITFHDSIKPLSTGQKDANVLKSHRIKIKNLIK